MGGGRVQPVMWQEASRGLRWNVQEEVSRHALKFHREEAVWLSVMPAQWQRLLVSSRSHSLWMNLWSTKRRSIMWCQTSWNWILKLPSSWIEPEIYLFNIFIFIHLSPMQTNIFYFLLKGKYKIIAIVNTQGIDKAKVTSHNK